MNKDNFTIISRWKELIHFHYVGASVFLSLPSTKWSELNTSIKGQVS